MRLPSPVEPRGIRILRRWLRRTETSHVGLGRQLGVSASQVSQWIHGARGIPLERALQIEQVSEGEVSHRDLRPDLYRRINGGGKVANGKRGRSARP